MAFLWRFVFVANDVVAIAAVRNNKISFYDANAKNIFSLGVYCENSGK